MQTLQFIYSCIYKCDIKMYTVFAMLGLYALIKRKKNFFAKAMDYVIGDHGYRSKWWYNLKLFPFSFKTLI